MTASSAQVLAEALRYAGMGLDVFPVNPRDKTPLTDHGFHDASRDRAQIEAWWEEHPDAAIGTPSLDAVDVDLYKPQAAATWKQIAPLIPGGTPYNRTGGGGLQFLFAPGTLRDGKIGPGVDNRYAGRNYIILPPSSHPSGGRYEVVIGLWEKRPPPAPDFPHSGGGGSEFQELRAQIDAGAKIIDGRNKACWYQAVKVLRAMPPGTDLAAVRDLMAKWVVDNCAGDLAQVDVAKQVRGAAKSVAKERAEALPKAPDPPDISIPPTKTEHGKKRIWSALELASLAPTSVPWVVPPWFAAGAVTEIEGKIKAAGKTTFMLAGCCAALEGKIFLGKRTERTPVVYLTEQPGTSFVVALRRAGLAGRADFRVISLWDVNDLDWFEIVALARDECTRVEAKLLVVDTLSAFARLEGDAENQAGAAQEAVRPLQVLAHEDKLAVAFGRHSRKGGGAVGESGRGSSAFAGAVDLLVSIRRREGNHPVTQRVLYTLGRFDEPPDDLVIDLTDAGYVVLGSEAGVDRDIVRNTILTLTKDAALTGDELLEAVKEEIGDSVSRNMVSAARQSLQDMGAIVREGKGTRGSAFTYTAAPEFLSSRPTSIWEETNSGEDLAAYLDALAAEIPEEPDDLVEDQEEIGDDEETA